LREKKARLRRDMKEGELVGTGVKVQALCPAVVRTEFHDVDGKPILRPNVPVMEPEDVVNASLAGLALGDVICSPALTDRGLLDNERQARHALFGGGRGAEPHQRQFVMTGICGDFTTFSMFSLETFSLAQTGNWLMAGLNIGVSVASWLVAVWLGHMLASRLNRLSGV
jgi:CrcB-like protein, Camphor Resistance (CrcB)